MVYQWIKKLQFQLFPATCLVCGATGENSLDLCAGCHRELPRNNQACECCGIPLYGDKNLVCGQCQQHPPPFTRTLTPFLYEPPMDHLIKLLKFQGQLAAATLLGNLLQEALAQRTVPLPEALLPVPLHPTRLAERGFNQALEIARIVSKSMAIPILTRAMQRHRPTPPQVSLDAKARRGNVRGAFRLQQPIQVRHIAIVDDVITTGSTVAELARVLKKAGVEEVEVWALARTPVDIIPN